MDDSTLLIAYGTCQASGWTVKSHCRQTCYQKVQYSNIDQRRGFIGGFRDRYRFQHSDDMKELVKADPTETQV